VRAASFSPLIDAFAANDEQTGRRRYRICEQPLDAEAANP
jgi:hypothetical protein